MVIILMVWAVIMYFIWRSQIQHPYTVGDNQVALMFSTGNQPENVHTIVDVLKERNTPATFFVTGEAAKNHPSMIQKIYTNGHGIGCEITPINHGKQLPEAQLENQSFDCKNTIASIIGKDPICFLDNNNNLTVKTQQYIESLGLVIIDNDIDTSKWDVGGQALIENVLRLIKPKSRITLVNSKLLKITSNRNDEDLSKLIQKISAMGLEFSRICYP